MGKTIISVSLGENGAHVVVDGTGEQVFSALACLTKTLMESIRDIGDVTEKAAAEEILNAAKTGIERYLEECHADHHN